MDGFLRLLLLCPMHGTDRWHAAYYGTLQIPSINSCLQADQVPQTTQGRAFEFQSGHSHVRFGSDTRSTHTGADLFSMIINICLLHFQER